MMRPVPEISDVMLAFPADVMDLLPAKEDIPEDDWYSRTPESQMMQQLFFKGGSFPDFGYVPKPGVDLKKVYRVFRAILGSFQPKHEHKIGGCAVLVREWFNKEKQDA